MAKRVIFRRLAGVGGFSCLLAMAQMGNGVALQAQTRLAPASSTARSETSEVATNADLEKRVETLEREVAELRMLLEKGGAAARSVRGPGAFQTIHASMGGPWRSGSGTGGGKR